MSSRQDTGWQIYKGDVIHTELGFNQVSSGAISPLHGIAALLCVASCPSSAGPGCTKYRAPTVPKPWGQAGSAKSPSLCSDPPAATLPQGPRRQVSKGECLGVIHFNGSLTSLMKRSNPPFCLHDSGLPSFGLQ